MRKMGDKDTARRTMRAAGVPVVPGCDLVLDPAAMRSREAALHRLSAAFEGHGRAAAAEVSAACNGDE